MGNANPRAPFSNSGVLLHTKQSSRGHILLLQLAGSQFSYFHAFSFFFFNQVKFLPHSCSSKQTDAGALSPDLTRAAISQSRVTFFMLAPEAEHMTTALLLLQGICQDQHFYLMQLGPGKARLLACSTPPRKISLAIVKGKQRWNL